MAFKKTTPKPPKKTLTEFLLTKEVITGKDMIHEFKEQEQIKKEFEKSVEDELRKGRGKKIQIMFSNRYQES
jgi:hypothetical protein